MKTSSNKKRDAKFLNLRNLDDRQLLAATETLVKTEREILLSVLHHLQEIDRRKLYSALKFRSLFDYVVKKLGYSEDQAVRRISAMRMLKSFSPEICERIESKINDGALCLTHLNMAQNLFNKEEAFLSQKISSEQKMEVLDKLENTSTREAEKIVIGLSSAPIQIPPEKLRPITDELSELKTVLNKEQLAKIQKLKGLLAHKNPKMSFTELLDVLLDLGIEKFDPGQKVVRTYQPKIAEQKGYCQINSKHLQISKPEDSNSPNSHAAPQLINKTVIKKVFSDATKPNQCKESPAMDTQLCKPTTSRFIPAKIKREVWRKHQSQCVNCKSTFALEIDHVQPVAMGGTSEIENLRLTCRSCNQRAARKKLGAHVMDRYTQGSFI
jgi:hypothetical protein